MFAMMAGVEGKLPPRLVMFTSLPRVGGHSTLTLGLCRMLREEFGGVDVWVRVMREHGHSAEAARALEAMGCRVGMLSGMDGRLRAGALAEFVFRGRTAGRPVFLTMAMRNLSPVLARLCGAQRSYYYQITHDLNPGTVAMVTRFARTFSKILFICPATYDGFPGAEAAPGKFGWVQQSSEIPVAGVEALPAERAEAAAESVGGRAVRFGLIGRLTPEKGARVMLDFVRGGGGGGDFELHVAGAGPEEGEFRRLAGGESAHGRPVVRFHGAYDPADRAGFLRKFFNGIDYLVVPSQDEWETLSMAALEAMQHGVPSVICRTGGLGSFGHPDLGPAPAHVVRLVDRGDLAGVLQGLARSGRPAWEAAGPDCLAHYTRWFSDDAVRGKWVTALGLRVP